MVRSGVGFILRQRTRKVVGLAQFADHARQILAGPIVCFCSQRDLYQSKRPTQRGLGRAFGASGSLPTTTKDALGFSLGWETYGLWSLDAGNTINGCPPDQSGSLQGLGTLFPTILIVRLPLRRALHLPVSNGYGLSIRKADAR